MAKDRKIKKDNEQNDIGAVNVNAPVVTSLSNVKYKPLPKFRGCINC